MRTGKRVMALIVAVLCLSFIVQACTQETTNQTSSPSTTTKATTTKATTTTATTDPQDTIDKIVFFGSDQGLTRYTDMEQKVHDRIKELFAIDLEMFLVPGEQVITKRDLMLATDEQIDVFTTDLASAVNLINDGLIIDHKDLVEQYGVDYKLNSKDGVVEGTVYKGQYLGFGMETAFLNLNYIFVRDEWLKEFGLQYPKNINDLEVYFEAIKTAGDNRIPLITPGDDHLQMIDTLANFYLPMGAKWFMDSSGKLTPPELHPNYQKMLAKLAEWYDKGYMPADLFVSNIQQKREWAANDRVAAWLGNHSAIIAGGVETIGEDAEVTYTPIMITGEPDAANKYCAFNPTVAVICITSKCAAPVKLAQFINWHYTAEGSTYLVWGPEGENYEVQDNGSFHFLGTDDPLDYNKAQYYLGMGLITSFPMSVFKWYGDNYMSRYYNREMSIFNTWEFVYPPDIYVIYDPTRYKSSAKVNDLETFLSENTIKVILGEESSGSWDTLMQEWLRIGGSDLIDDKNTQYQEWLALQ